jgi:hypothetical protein
MNRLIIPYFKYLFRHKVVALFYIYGLICVIEIRRLKVWRIKIICLLPYSDIDIDQINHAYSNTLYVLATEIF